MTRIEELKDALKRFNVSRSEMLKDCAQASLMYSKECLEEKFSKMTDFNTFIHAQANKVAKLEMRINAIIEVINELERNRIDIKA